MHTKKILILILIATVLVLPTMAANDSMNWQDIQDAEPSIPVAGGFITMVVSFSKFVSYLGFVIGIAVVLAKGPISSAMNDANMSSASQNGLFFIGKFMLIGAAVYITGTYIFQTYL